MSRTLPQRTRVAPSPTGDAHVGTGYMALFDLAWARRTGGQFVLRVEDTDQARLAPGSEESLIELLNWLGLAPDEGPATGGPFGPYRQSERLGVYDEHIEELLAAGHAYKCWCSKERLAELREARRLAKDPDTGYDRFCLGKTRDQRAAEPGFSPTPVVRMLIPDDAPCSFHDLVRGDVAAPRPDDQVIRKADGFPTYHLAVVVDDHLMGITTVVRGEEWISSTPKHLLLYRWFGYEQPAFAHMPLLRNPDKTKISKRNNPAARLAWFKDEGYLPEALRNLLQLMAYPPVTPDGNEVATFEQFVEAFDWAKVNTTAPIFDLAKLDWLNGQWCRRLGADELADRIIDHLRARRALDGVSAEGEAALRAATPLIQPRIQRLGDAADMCAFLLAPDDQIVTDPAAKLPEDAGEILDEALAVLERAPAFTAETIHAGLRARLVEELGRKARVAFAPIRVGITGSVVSPPLFESMEILGRDSCLTRLRRFRARL